MYLFKIIVYMFYVCGFIFATFRSARLIVLSNIASKNTCAEYAMTFGVALLWPIITIEDCIRVFVLKQRNKGWDE